MSKVRSTETKPEKIVRSFLFSNGFRFRKNSKHLPGKPDIVLPKYKTAIFVHGCFWHGHKKCKAAKLPATRKRFWEYKIGDNRNRDSKNIKELKKAGWKTIVVWQCQIGNKTKQEKTLNALIKKLI